MNFNIYRVSEEVRESCEMDLSYILNFIRSSAQVEDFLLAQELKQGKNNFSFMIVFTTVLEIDGSPTLYSVYRNRGLAFLNPTTRKAPILFASYDNCGWIVKGTEDLSIQRQVLNEIAVSD